jgi:predicted glycogen debranching enzyme
MRRLSLEFGEHRARLEYEIENAPPGVQLFGRPFLPLRDFHALDHEHGSGSPRVGRDGQTLILERDGHNVRVSGAALRDDPQWWRDFAYTLDRDRGQEWMEDLWSPGEFMATPVSGVRMSAAIDIELASAPRPPARLLDEVSQRGAITGARPQLERNRERESLRVAARAFVVGRCNGPDDWTASVVAGYPWFGDWGRDTMIGLPGLLLARERALAAEQILLCFARHLRNGLIPNLFDDYGGAAHYNTVDASLWFVHAVHALNAADKPVQTSSNRAELIRACREIIVAYQRGTDFNIHMDQQDGLIVAGDATTQLTWMDAARDGVVFTPRWGKAVEINALWHNALLCLSELTNDHDERGSLVMLARKVAAAFRGAFWWEQRQCLHDCLMPSGPDGRVRPNQILAVSLPFSPLSEQQQRAVVKLVGERLLTPFGLRTLDRDDPNYKPRYEGSLFQRDAAYHNGTVWPWLIGPYCEALLRVEQFSDAAKQRVRGILQPLLDEMRDSAGGRCLGQIAEVYDGDPPHRPSGCPAQAWSVAEVLRIATIIR